MSSKFQKILIIEVSSIICRGLHGIFTSDISNYWQVQINNSLENFNATCTDYYPDIVLITPLTYIQNQELIDKAKQKYGFQLVGIIYNHYHNDILRKFDAQIKIDDSDQNIINIINQLDYLKSDNSSTEIADALSKREKEILKLIASGYASSKIAESLFISLHTVNTHRKNIMNKLDIKTVAGLTIYAVLNNIISLKEV